MKTIIIAALMLTGCASIENPLTMNVMPTLSPDVVATRSAACPKNTTPRPYPPAKPQVVFCDAKSVLPPGYVRPAPVYVMPY